MESSQWGAKVTGAGEVDLARSEIVEMRSEILEMSREIREMSRQLVQRLGQRSYVRRDEQANVQNQQRAAEGARGGTVRPYTLRVGLAVTRSFGLGAAAE